MSKQKASPTLAEINRLRALARSDGMQALEVLASMDPTPARHRRAWVEITLAADINCGIIEGFGWKWPELNLFRVCRFAVGLFELSPLMYLDPIGETIEEPWLLNDQPYRQFGFLNWHIHKHRKTGKYLHPKYPKLAKVIYDRRGGGLRVNSQHKEDSTLHVSKRGLLLSLYDGCGVSIDRQTISAVV